MSYNISSVSLYPNFEEVNKEKSGDLTEFNLVTQQDVYYVLDLLSQLPDPSIILTRLIEQGITKSQLFKEMLDDSEIVSNLQRTKADLEIYKQQITSTGETQQDNVALELCQETFHSGRKEENWEMFKVILFGRQLLQFNYKKYKNYLIPDEFKVVEREDVLFNVYGEPLIQTQGGTLELLNNNPKYENQWVLLQHMPDQINPYGVALLEACYWLWYFKRNGLKSLALHVDQFTNPPVVGKNQEEESGVTDEQVASELTNLHLMGVGVFPNGIDIDQLELNDTSTIPQWFMTFLNYEITKILTGQAQVGEPTASGSYASDRVADEAQEKLYAMRRNIVSAAWHDVFESLIKVNFPNSWQNIVVPEHNFITEKQASTTWADFFETVSKHSTNGIPISTEEYYELIGINKPESVTDDVIVLGGNVQQSLQSFSNKSNKGITLNFQADGTTKLDKISEQAALDFAKQITDTELKQIREIVLSSDTPEQVTKGLSDLYSLIAQAKKKELS